MKHFLACVFLLAIQIQAQAHPFSQQELRTLSVFHPTAKVMHFDDNTFMFSGHSLSWSEYSQSTTLALGYTRAFSPSSNVFSSAFIHIQNIDSSRTRNLENAKNHCVSGSHGKVIDFKHPSYGLVKICVQTSSVYLADPKTHINQKIAVFNAYTLATEHFPFNEVSVKFYNVYSKDMIKLLTSLKPINP